MSAFSALMQITKLNLRRLVALFCDQTKTSFYDFFFIFLSKGEKTIGKISFFSGKYTLPETNLCVPSVCFSGATAQHCKLSLTNSGSEEPFFRKRRQVLSTDASYCHQENQEHEFLLHLQNSS